MKKHMYLLRSFAPSTGSRLAVTSFWRKQTNIPVELCGGQKFILASSQWKISDIRIIDSSEFSEFEIGTFILLTWDKGNFEIVALSSKCLVVFSYSSVTSPSPLNKRIQHQVQWSYRTGYMCHTRNEWYMVKLRLCR